MRRLLHCSSVIKFSRNLMLSSVALLLSTASVDALPGQKLETIRQWAKESFVLPPKLVYNPEYDAYTGIRTIENGMLALYVKVRPQDNISVREQVVTQINAPELKFARTDAEGLKLIGHIYTPEIADDYQTSRYIAQIGKTDFYRGTKFAYITLEQKGIQRFSVIPLNELNQAIQREVSCQTKNCVVYQPFSLLEGRNRGASGS